MYNEWVYVAERVKLNKNFKNMHNYLRNSNLVNIKWVSNNLEIDSHLP